MHPLRALGTFLMVASPVVGLIAALATSADIGLAVIVGGFLAGLLLYILGERIETSRIAPPPGWYRDPAGQTRWWDGHQWTGYVAPPTLRL